MLAKFSEFNYGHGITKEWENEYEEYFLSIPKILNLKEEGKKGYDTKLDILGVPYFLQFKLAKKLTRSNAKQWSHYSAEYFRYKIYSRKKSNQHNLLKHISKDGYPAFYSSPKFIYHQKFSRYYKEGKLIAESKFTPLKNLPFIKDTKRHCVCYDLNGNNTNFYSEKTEIEPFEINIENLLGSVKKEKFQRLCDVETPMSFVEDIIQAIERAYELLCEISKEDTSFAEKNYEINMDIWKYSKEIEQDWLKLDYLSRSLLGSEVLILIKTPLK